MTYSYIGSWLSCAKHEFHPVEWVLNTTRKKLVTLKSPMLHCATGHILLGQSLAKLSEFISDYKRGTRVLMTLLLACVGPPDDQG